MNDLLYQYNPWWENLVEEKKLKSREKYLRDLRKYLSYNQLKPYMGGIYNVTLGLGEVSDTADITISADVYKTINNNEVPIDGETIKFDISSSMGHTGTYYKTTDRTGATDPFWITFTYTKESDTVTITATHEGSGQVQNLAVTYDAFQKQYYDFRRAALVSKAKTNFDFVI